MSEKVTKEQMDAAYEAWEIVVNGVHIENDASAAEWRAQADLFKSFKQQGYLDPKGECDTIREWRDGTLSDAITKAHDAMRKLQELGRQYFDQQADIK